MIEFMFLPQALERYSKKTPQINTAHICQGVIKFSRSPDATLDIHTNIYGFIHIYTQKCIICTWQRVDLRCYVCPKVE